jgi:hypothetical protein
MTTYTFEVKGKPIYSTDVCVNVPGARSYLAILEANKHFGERPQGIWIDARRDHFYWVEGDFEGFGFPDCITNNKERVAEATLSQD